MPKYKTVNPLSMIPKKEDLPEGRSLYEVAKTLAPNVVKEFETPYNEVKNTGKLLYNAAMGEDAEGLLFGAEFIPGVSLTAKLQQGKTPGLLDILDVPSFKGLTGLKTLGAMVPIGTTLMEFQQGKRMGKLLRNIEKAKNPMIERWHRTRSKNDAGITNKGILVGKDNPNYGKNTGDEDQLQIPAAWLATNPTEIPVLQWYFLNKPNEVSTYRVRIPKGEYYATPRLKWDDGYRGSASKARIVGKGESSLTGEVGRQTGKKSLIDLFGKSIPPQYLEKVSPSDMKQLVLKDDDRQVLNSQFRALYGRDATPQELYDFSEKLNKKLTYSERQPHIVGAIDDAVDASIRDANYTKNDLYPVSPKQALEEALRVNKVGISNEMPYGSIFADIVNDDLKSVGENIGLSEGAISRGNKFRYKFPSTPSRQYNWSKFKDLTNRQGMSPAEAHARSMPVTAVDWDSGTFTRLNTPHLRNFFDEIIESPQRGSISRAMDDHTVPTAKALRMISDKYPRLHDVAWTSPAVSDLESVIGQSYNPSALIEAIAKAKSGTLAKMKGPLKNISFDTKLGKIGMAQSTRQGLTPYEFFKGMPNVDKETILKLMRENIEQNIKEVKPFAIPRSLKDYIE